MVLIESQMARTIGFMVLVRSHPRLKNSLRVWSNLQELKDAISMPARTTPWQKTMEFVDGFKGKLPDEELAVIKRYVEK